MPLPSCVSSCSLFVINVLITINHYSVLSFELILKDTHMPGLQISSSLHTLLNVLRKLRRKGKTHTASCNLKAHSVYDPPPNLFPAPTTFQSSKFPSLCFPLSPIFSSCTPWTYEWHQVIHAQRLSIFDSCLLSFPTSN